MRPWTKSSSVTIQMKATEQYFTVVLFIMLCKVAVAFESVDKILKCGHSNESSTFLFCCSLCSGMLFQCLTPWMKSYKAIEQYFLVVLFSTAVCCEGGSSFRDC